MSRTVTSAVTRAKRRANAAASQYKTIEDGAKAIAQEYGISVDEARNMIIEEIESDGSQSASEAVREASASAAGSATPTEPNPATPGSPPNENPGGRDNPSQEAVENPENSPENPPEEPPENLPEGQPPPEVRPQVEHPYYRKLWGRK